MQLTLRQCIDPAIILKRTFTQYGMIQVQPGMTNLSRQILTRYFIYNTLIQNSKLQMSLFSLLVWFRILVETSLALLNIHSTFQVLMDGTMQESKKYNLYDSWRSEWNGYYYNPSHTSSKYGGYDSTTNLSRHHHPDYDTNF